MEKFNSVKEIFLALKKTYDEGGMDAVHEKVKSLEASKETLEEIKYAETFIDEVNANRTSLEKNYKAGFDLSRWYFKKSNELKKK